MTARRSSPAHASRCCARCKCRTSDDAPTPPRTRRRVRGAMGRGPRAPPVAALMLTRAAEAVSPQPSGAGRRPPPPVAVSAGGGGRWRHALRAGPARGHKPWARRGGGDARRRRDVQRQPRAARVRLVAVCLEPRRSAARHACVMSAWRGAPTGATTRRARPTCELSRDAHTPPLSSCGHAATTRRTTCARRLRRPPSPLRPRRRAPPRSPPTARRQRTGGAASVLLRRGTAHVRFRPVLSYEGE